MSVLRVHHVETVAAGQQLGQLGLQPQRVQPVGGDSADHRGHRATLQRGLDATAVTSDVVARQRIGERDVGPGIEARDQLSALVLQIALHRVASAVTGVLPGLRIVAESVIQFMLAAVGQMSEASRDLQADIGAAACAVVVAAAPVRVGLDGRDLIGLRADLVGGRAGADGQDQPGPYPIGMGDHPLQCAGTAHRASDHGGDLADTEPVEHRDVRGHLIADRHRGKA